MASLFPNTFWCAAAAMLAAGSVLAAPEGASASGAERSTAAASGPTFDVIFAQPEVSDRIRTRAAEGCWVVFHDGVDYVGRRLTLLGPVAVSDFASSMPNWRRWDSAIVGPRARVTAFQDTGFQKQLAILQPGQRVGNLDDREFGWRKDMGSVRVTCAQRQ